MAISITAIKMGLDTCYLVKQDDVIAIDGGGFHKINKFKRGIKKAGINPDAV
jgi:hypothetical protein